MKLFFPSARTVKMHLDTYMESATNDIEEVEGVTSDECAEKCQSNGVCQTASYYKVYFFV